MGRMLLKGKVSLPPQTHRLDGSHFLVTAAHLGCGSGGKSGLCPSSTLFEMGASGESQEMGIEGRKEERSRHKRASLGFLSH